MKITISQEGASPISIDTEALRSEEEYTPGKIYNAARVGLTAAKNAVKLGVAGLDQKFTTTASIAAAKKLNKGLYGNFAKRMLDKKFGEGMLQAGYKSAMASAKQAAKVSPKVFIDKGAREAAKKSVDKVINDAMGRTGNAALQVTTNKQIYGAAALGLAANPVLMYFLTSIVGPSLAATIYNTITSIGTFKSGEDFLKSKQFIDKFQSKIKNKYAYFPKIDEVKKSTKAKTKSGFLAWILGGGQSAGDSVKSQMGTTKFLMKSINGVPVAVTQLMPVLGTMDLKQMFGKRVIIATGFVFDTAGEIKSVPICRGYLKKGLLGKNEVNPNAVADSSYESGNVIMGYFSSESAGPVFTEDADEFIAMDDEYEDDECGDCIDDGEEMTW